MCPLGGYEGGAPRVQTPVRPQRYLTRVRACFAAVWGSILPDEKVGALGNTPTTGVLGIHNDATVWDYVSNDKNFTYIRKTILAELMNKEWRAANPRKLSSIPAWKALFQVLYNTSPFIDREA